MEIYWDRMQWAEALPRRHSKRSGSTCRGRTALRGFSKFSQADDSSPELPDYNRSKERLEWRDLIDITRGTATCANCSKDRRPHGDRLRGRRTTVKFAALPAPPAAGARYVMVGDGWIKDGDLNSTFQRRSAPAYHGLKDYNIARPA